MFRVWGLDKDLSMLALEVSEWFRFLFKGCFKIWGPRSRFGVLAVEFQGFGFRVQGLASTVGVWGFRGVGFRVQGLAFTAGV